MGLTEFCFLGKNDVFIRFQEYLNLDKIRSYDGEYYAAVCTLNRKGELVDLWNEDEFAEHAEPHATLEMLKSIEPEKRWERALSYVQEMVDGCALFMLSRLKGLNQDSYILKRYFQSMTVGDRPRFIESDARKAAENNVETWIIQQALDLVNSLDNMSGSFCTLDADTEYVITSYALDRVTSDSPDATLLFVEIHR